MGFCPKRREVFRQQALRRPHGDTAKDAGGKAAAEIGSFNANRKAGPRYGRIHGSGKEQRRQIEVVDGRGLARNAVMIHRVDAVRGDVHLEERTTAGRGEFAFHGNAAQGEVFGELPVVDRQLGKIGAKPMRKNIQANCSRKRVSPE